MIPTNENRRFRIRYSKTGRAAFHSHLDTIRTFEKAARRSGLALSYTSGFNPHVRFSARSALPVGLAVERESIWYRFEREYEPAEIAGAFNGRLPAGFRVESVDRDDDDAPSGELVFEIEHGASAACARDAVAAWIGRDRIEVVRARGGTTSIVDLRPFLQEADTGADRIVLRVRAVEGAFPRLSDLLKAIHEISSFASPPLEIHGVTRLG